MSQVIAEAGGFDPVRIAALSGPNLALEIARGLPASAVVAADDESPGGARPGEARAAAVPSLREQRSRRGRAVRGAQERPRDRGGCGRGARLRGQRQGRPDDPRSRRDDPARDRRRREPADVRRPGRDRRRHRDVRVAAVAQPPARRRARQGPLAGPRSRRACRASPKAPTRSMRRSPWPTGSGWRCRSPARSTARCSKARASKRCLVDLLARESKDELADYRQWVASARRATDSDNRLLDSAPRRGVAQSGSAPVWGTGGRRFKSGRPDHFPSTNRGPEGFVPRAF